MKTTIVIVIGTVLITGIICDHIQSMAKIPQQPRTDIEFHQDDIFIKHHFSIHSTSTNFVELSAQAISQLSTKK